MNWLKARIVYYPTLGWNVLLGRILKVRNWWDPIDDVVVIGAMPFRSDVAAMKQLGITGVVNTCQEFSGPQDLYQKHAMEQLRVPTIDFTHPSLENVERAVAFIETQAAAGGKVYVHCKAGRARSGTVVVCWLIRSKAMSRQEAQKRLLEQRPHANPRIDQRPVVIEFEKREMSRKDS